MTAPGDIGPWRLVPAPGRRPARAWREADGTLAVEAEGAVGFLVRALRPEEIAAPILAWSWRVDAAPPPTDLAAPGADDRPGAVHLAYAGSGLAGLMARGLGDALGLGPLTGRLLSYVWGGLAPPGSVLATPRSGGRAMIWVRRGPEAALGTWLQEAVAPAADFRTAFSTAAPPPTHLLISADTDDRGGRALARFREPVFLADWPAPTPLRGTRR